MIVDGWRLSAARLAYRRPVRWAGHAEPGADVLVLELRTREGACGVGEATVRLSWHAATLRSLAVTLEEVFLPRLVGLDIDDEAALARVLARVRDHALARAAIDMALWDLRAQAAGVALWRRLGAGEAAADSVPVSWTVTRAEPAAMAREAGEMRAAHGFRAFKIKTGQGLATDRQALAAIRAAVGDDVALTADSNRASKPADVAAMADMLASFGVSHFEDPCDLTPANFAQVAATSRLPILVDDGCRSPADARRFLDAGAPVVSVKTMKTGLTDSLAIARAAQAQGAGAAVGISATSGLGALFSLSLSAAIPEAAQPLPCEESFFLALERDLLSEPLEVRDGAVRLPGIARAADLIDGARLTELARG